MAAQVFRYAHRVSYAECTVGNHIYYARYLDLLEKARGEYFRHLGTSFRHWHETDTIFPVTECSLLYKAPASYDELLTIEGWLTELERVRVTFAYRILNEAGRDVLLASTRHACTTLQQKPKRLPAELESLLRPYLLEGAASRGDARSTGFE